MGKTQMSHKYFVRTIGDQKIESDFKDFEQAVVRALGNSDYQEAAISDKANEIFSVRVKNFAISIVYTGECDRYFDSDQVSMVRDARRHLSNFPFAVMLRGLMAKECKGLDEAWINLSKVRAKIVVVHTIKDISSEAQSMLEFALEEIRKSGLPYRSFRYEDEEKEKQDIDRLMGKKAPIKIKVA